jgi:hypothetical protein
MTCTHFALYELVDRRTYEQWGEDAWNLLNPDLLYSIDGIREFFDRPCYINNWYNGHGSNQYRGYRPPDCPIGALKSEHKRGNAADMTIEGIDAEMARQTILDNQDHPLLCKIMRLEANTPWLHLDLKNVSDRIHLFKA